MKINENFDQRAVIDTSNVAWQPSPYPGLVHKLLDCTDDEVPRVSRIIQYAAGSSLPEQGLGDEFLVLDGVFSDGQERYPAGSYVRIPPGSPRSSTVQTGCELFLKQSQFQAGDQIWVVIDTHSAPWRPGLVAGLQVLPLHEHGGEHIALVRWAPGTRFQPHTHWGGEEIMVLEGVFSDEGGDYPAGTWLRSPHMSRHTPFSEQGCLIYVKVGHLA